MTPTTRTHLSRLTLRRQAGSVAPLLKDLMPPEKGAAMDIHHRLLWTVFSGTHKQPGDEAAFLWRYMDGDDKFFVLGPEPQSGSPFFDIETKPFSISFHRGQRLAFELRVNATVDRMIDPSKGRAGRKRCDVVQDAMNKVRKEQVVNDREQRDEIARMALTGWLSQQGDKSGFHLRSLSVKTYRAIALPGQHRAPGPQADVADLRPATKLRKRAPGPQMGVADLLGVLEVSDPSAFMDKVHKGFGRSKAYGCGLMLLRPVA